MCLWRQLCSSWVLPTGLPILPVLLKYRHKHFNVGWGITYNYWHLYRLFTQFVNHLEVRRWHSPAHVHTPSTITWPF